MPIPTENNFENNKSFSNWAGHISKNKYRMETVRKANPSMIIRKCPTENQCQENHIKFHYLPNRIVLGLNDTLPGHRIIRRHSIHLSINLFEDSNQNNDLSIQNWSEKLWLIFDSVTRTDRSIDSPNWHIELSSIFFL